ncbi:MAG TPA: hypothetical protein VH684_22765 [Xanthobacteraceae bacterium]|jgi:hypothetical protein
MKRMSRAVIAAVLAVLAIPTFAQVVPFPPELQGRIPAPLPPPPQAPIINGPLGQSPPPGVYVPPRLNTFADRMTHCIDQGTSYGLHGRRLHSYARRCASVH